MSLKRSNLCLSADVTSSAALLHLADVCGPHIAVLKTHADIVADFSVRATAAPLQALAARHGFLVFEDRKFGDIGHTVQMQYTGGPLRIADWAPITNAHMFPGPAVVASLEAAAARVVVAAACSRRTEITGGGGGGGGGDTSVEPASEPTGFFDAAVLPPATAEDEHGDAGEHEHEDAAARARRAHLAAHRIAESPLDRSTRKASVVSIATTISATRETLPSGLSVPVTPASSALGATGPPPESLAALGPPPVARGLLLLAQMSSADNAFTPAYTALCVAAARRHRRFVIGYVAQEGLNGLGEGEGEGATDNDNFITMTPGVALPPKDDEEHGGVAGDAQGQRYNTPWRVVVERGCDVVIVGRGIVNAEDPAEEAQRYREEAWTAYLARVQPHGP